MFKIYNGNTQQYFTELFNNNEEFLNMLESQDLHGNIEEFANVLSLSMDEYQDLWGSLESASTTAVDFYNKQLESRGLSKQLLDIFQEAVLEAFGVVRPWYMLGSDEIYKCILRVLLYGSTNNFFYNNIKTYIPEYDLALIERDTQRKEFVENIFKEFDKLSMIVASLKNCTDIDTVPKEHLIKLMKITGLTVNDYNNVLSETQIRELAKNIIEVYRSKGSIQSFNILFNSIGIEPDVKELFFDRRLIYQISGDEIYDFKKYLTPHNPTETSVMFTDEDVNTGELVYPMSEYTWDYLLNSLNDDDKTLALKYMLGYIEETDEVKAITCKDGRSFIDVKNSVAEGQTFSYFKANFISFEFSKYVGGSSVKITDPDELRMCTKMVDKICPIYIKKIYL